MAPPSKPPSEGGTQKEQAAAGIKKEVDPKSARELIEEEIGNIDKNPGLSSQEKEIAEKTLKQLEARYGIEKLDTKITIRHQLVALQASIVEVIEKYRADAKPERTDIVDLNATLAGVFKRVEIEKAVKHAVQNSPLKNKMQDVVSHIETVGDLRRLEVDKLIKLEDFHEGILLYAFSDVASGDTKVNLEHFYWKPQQGTELRVDFRGNHEAEAVLGAADLLPPSVRRITVYERGDKSLARTSERRIGLKGRNINGHGFFDKDGYIPIYTGDIVVVGGVPQEKENGQGPGIDLAFEAKYRKKEEVKDPQTGQPMRDVKGEIIYALHLDYEKYEKDEDGKKADDKYIGTIKEKAKKDGRHIRMGKQYTEDELKDMEKEIGATGIRQKIVEAVRHLIINPYEDPYINKKGQELPAEHCGDWVRKVYARAGAKDRSIYRHANYVKGVKVGQEGFDDNPKNPPLVSSLEPGDWLAIHNRNGKDDFNDHSVIFLRWLDKDNLIAEVASYGGPTIPPRIHRANLNDTPNKKEAHAVTKIKKPIAT